MALDKIKDSESDSRPPGEARNRTSLRERITSLFHNKKTKRNPKLDDDLDSMSIQSGWSDSTLADTEKPGSSSGHNPRRGSQQASRHLHRNAGDRPVNARSRAITNRRAGPGSRYTDQERLRGESGSSVAQAAPRPSEYRSVRTNGSTANPQRGYRSLSNATNPSLRRRPNRLRVLTPMRRPYVVHSVDGLYDFDERYGRGFEHRYGRSFGDRYGRSFGDRYGRTFEDRYDREGWYDDDDFYGGDDGFDDNDGTMVIVILIGLRSVAQASEVGA